MGHRHPATTPACFVSPPNPPGPYQREILDIIEEEAVEVAMALGETNAQDPTTTPSYTQEVGDFLAIYTMVLENGLIGRPDHRPKADAGRSALALTIAQRASKCRRFGLDETQPG